MDITLNLSAFQHFLTLPPDQALLTMLFTVGWIPIAVVFLYGIFLIFVDYKQGIFSAKQKYTLLAIDIPKENDLSLRAVENLFTYFAGAHGSINLIEEYWEGKFQLCFSFEVVSIDGYTQFIVRCPEAMRDLTESAFYSQYPDAEITEINDYTEGIPRIYPDEEWDIWGVEFVMTKNHMLPIKTYEAFEHQMGEPETHFKDPMAVLMDLNSTLKPGEQIWWQLIVKPIGFDWMGEGDKEISKILKEKPKRKGGIINGFSDLLFKILGETADITRGLWGTPVEPKKKEAEKDDALKMMNLKPREKKQVEAIQRKTSKIAFECKNRFIYVAKKEVLNKGKVVNGFVGFIKQFTDIDTNGLKPDLTTTGTRANYFFKNTRINTRKRKIMSAYKSRSGTVGKKKYILNIEELATLWHFPMSSVVKAPLIQKAPGRKAEPPMSLPIETRVKNQSFFSETGKDIFTSGDVEFKKANDKNASQNQAPSSPDIFSDDIFVSPEPPKKSNPTPIEKGAPPANLPFA